MSANTFVRCGQRHWHWGRYGAAGLLITDGARVVLQHRSIRTHEGGAWAFAGGARERHETARDAALREAAEETGLDHTAVKTGAEWVDDHDGWTYTTVLAQAAPDLLLQPINFESTEVRWWAIDEVAGLKLHSGFAAAWPTLRELIAEHYGS